MEQKYDFEFTIFRFRIEGFRNVFGSKIVNPTSKIPKNFYIDFLSFFDLLTNKRYFRGLLRKRPNDFETDMLPSVPIAVFCFCCNGPR